MKPAVAAPRRNIAAQLAYDGANFVGSQSQRSGRTVQDEVERAWLRLTGEQQRWTFAGRTDAGVHAAGQVANVRTGATHKLGTVQRALNALLPPDIVVRRVWEASDDFHARFSALERRYRYTLLAEPWPVPLLRTTAWHLARPLQVAAMDAAAQHLHGEHDFAAFGVVDQGSTVRRCTAARCWSVEQDGYALIIIEMAANGFLRHMVRALVGTLVEVGLGRRSVAEFAEILASADRRRAGRTAPPQGLSLVAVRYADMATEILTNNAVVAARSDVQPPRAGEEIYDN